MLQKKKPVEEVCRKPWYRWENDVRKLTAMLNVPAPRDGPRRYYKLFERHNNEAIQRFDQMRSPFTVSNLPMAAPPQYQAGPLYSPIVAPYPPVNIRLP
uniref:Retrovirus-related Pol polyprotein from transposon TNT 1-94 n=1 Tax=Bursaphelenchus xylophilus TaxID=6326 RepID=A0A1I7RX15_BURXY